ncbi:MULTISPECIES: hypothetical protein [unclassified Bartonella]|uniref:hypothetical protein n=2 Tax=Bartonella TaxID=773 RepID=UPI0035D0BC69
MQIDKQSVFGSGRSVLHKGFDLIKEREKQKREAMRNLYYLKDITLDAFESRKAELKNDAKNGNWFAPLQLHILLKLGGCIATFKDYANRDT